MKEWLLVFVMAGGNPGISGPYTFEMCQQMIKVSPRSFCVLQKDIRVIVRYPPRKM